MKRVAVGVDGSKISRDALLWGSKLAVSVGADVLAVNFVPPYPQLVPEDHNRLLAGREQALAGSWTAPATEVGAKVMTVVGEGDPRNALLPLAEAEGADLVVLGRTGGGGGPGVLHLGSVVEQAAHHTSIPLAVIPAGWSSPIERIVVGVDGSPESLAAVAWVAEIAPALKASVVAVQVEEPYFEWTPVSSPDNWRRDVERHIKDWTTQLTESGVSVQAVAKRDLYPADALLGVAAARNGDLLVLGTRGVGGFTGLRAGGVALKVLHRANLPLVLVPRK